MHQKLYEAIRLEWAKITTDEQRSLIHRYIQGDGRGVKGSWMEFLQHHFGLQPSLLSRQTGAKSR